MTTTEKVKHTSGPWYVSDMGICDSESCDVLCRDNQDESDANARLIAASPEMLSALEAARDYHYDGTPLEAMSDLERHTIKLIEDAIRRAKGE